MINISVLTPETRKAWAEYMSHFNNKYDTYHHWWGTEEASYAFFILAGCDDPSVFPDGKGNSLLKLRVMIQDAAYCERQAAGV